ncbi:GntR family transcriptional regulator [Actinoplanes lutulentus]|uniref:GntR family transcriptional regulator n=1 Tax=Actinoplanes lutulentus TaxID=1287878 RepID=A0A327ZGP5_9ACTN|nr:GntR family transcriptional regulator [Actinoplanes lutulentus]MBB2945340.1 GntR family transcriptional regulator [Actinoplanes lutulentus]RAK40525.1 GntR family transcriptional regulator [Actinoplanes lutulentus]
MTGMRIDPAPAKYAMIANTLQARIDSGTYPTGSMLPSEAQLVREFEASRSTVVRALEYLRQLGYIEGVQGKGRAVLGTPRPRSPRLPGRIFAALHGAEIGVGTLIGAGRAPASPRIAAALAIPIGEAVIARQRIMPASDSEQTALSTVFLPAITAGGTALGGPNRLREGILDHLEQRRQFVAGDVIERLTARTASPREDDLLRLGRRTLVLASLLIVRNTSGHPVLVFDLVIPAGPLGIEELFIVH